MGRKSRKLLQGTKEQSKRSEKAELGQAEMRTDGWYNIWWAQGHQEERHRTNSTNTMRQIIYDFEINTEKVRSDTSNTSEAYKKI